jgi:excisionase family DNA binding protein
MGIISARTIPNPADEPTITIERAAAILGISLRAGYNAVERGDIPSIRIGRRIVVPTCRFLAVYSLAGSDENAA